MAADSPHAELEAALWGRWAASRDADTKAKLVHHYGWLPRTQAARALRERQFDADLERAELEQLGMVGLLESIERYSSQHGGDFVLFARKRIYGAIVDGINRGSDLRAQLSAAYEMRQERIRSIQEQNPARDRLSRLVDVAAGLAIGIMLEGTGMFRDERDESLLEYSSNELEVLGDQFKREVDKLPDKQRDIIKRHYYQDFSFTEIAELLGISKARVSQLHAIALQTIRERLSQLELVQGFV